MNLELLREFFHYAPEEGTMVWKKDKPPRGVKGQPVGYQGQGGYWVACLGGKMCYLQRVAWALTYGEVPKKEIMFRDGDPSNLKLQNLVPRSQAIPQGELTLERVRALLDYDPETGVFRWKDRFGKSRTVEQAGCWASREGSEKIGRRHIIIIDRRRYQSPHLAFALQMGRFLEKGEWIDHKDGNIENNRWSNLRLVTPQKNTGNQVDRQRQTELPRGVEEFTRKSKPSDFGYALMFEGKRYRKRGFPSAEAAHAAYKKLHQELHGEFSVYASRPQA